MQRSVQVSLIGIHRNVDFERTRTKFRCCNKILYGIHGVLRVFSWNRANQVVKRYINKVKQYNPLFGGRGRVVTDMKHIQTEPLNMIGMNIPSIYGGILKDKYWESREEDKFLDRKLLKGCGRIDIKGWDMNDTEYVQTSEDDDGVFKY